MLLTVLYSMRHTVCVMGVKLPTYLSVMGFTESHPFLLIVSSSIKRFLTAGTHKVLHRKGGRWLVSALGRSCFKLPHL